MARSHSLPSTLFLMAGEDLLDKLQYSSPNNNNFFTYLWNLKIKIINYFYQSGLGTVV